MDKAALVESQRAWLKYREANCSFLSKEKSEGGVIANKMKIDCIIQSTKERIVVLKELMADYSL